MISCSKCGKENQDHYKFCLGCGAELPRGTAAKPFAPTTPSRGIQAGASARPPAAAQTGSPPAVAGLGGTVAVSPPRTGSSFAATAAATASGDQARPVAAPDQVVCPQCSHPNVKGNRFCASCGYNLGSVGPSAPPPGVAAVEGSATQSITLTALRADGSEAGTHRLPDSAQITIGRDTGSIFAGDSYLSPRHATFLRQGGQVRIKDEGSLNGVYLKLKPNEPHVLDFGDLFRIGQEIVRVEELKHQSRTPDGVERFGSPSRGYIGRLALVIGRDTTGNAFPIPERGVHCGRERGDILFSEDGYVSGLHCKIAKGGDGKLTLTDVGSSNGTFIRLRAERGIHSGDILLMGQQLFRVDF